MPPEDTRKSGSSLEADAELHPEGVIFEMISSGNATKVSAIDGASGFEVCIVGSSKESQAELQRVALAKLDFVMNKQNKTASRSTDRGFYV
ncbi:MAG: hypothetical protein KUG61_06960 [Parvibaculaceae bacterium]|nr:hypothetical protein [Parvibaculaceae bacterium]